MGIMRCEPDFLTGEVQQREFIVKESSISVLVEIAVCAAPLVDLVLFSVCIVELVSEQLIDDLFTFQRMMKSLQFRYSFFVESIIYVLSRITYPHPGLGCHW